MKPAFPYLVKSMKMEAWDLDWEVRQRLLAASETTLDRLLKPIRTTAGIRRKRRCRQHVGRQVPVVIADANMTQ